MNDKVSFSLSSNCFFTSFPSAKTTSAKKSPAKSWRHVATSRFCSPSKVQSPTRATLTMTRQFRAVPSRLTLTISFTFAKSTTMTGGLGASSRPIRESASSRRPSKLRRFAHARERRASQRWRVWARATRRERNHEHLMRWCRMSGPSYWSDLA